MFVLKLLLNIYNFPDFLFLNKNKRSATKNYGFIIWYVVTTHLHYNFAYYCFQSQNYINS